MQKIITIIISIILFLVSNFWLAKNEKDVTKGIQDFCAIELSIISIIMFLIAIFEM